MGILEERQRTICTRGITLTKDQMYLYRIRRIQNAVGDPEYLNDEAAGQMLDNCIKNGDCCLLEVTNDGKLYKISVLIFEDIWSRNVFALFNMKYYEGFPDLITIYN